MRVLSILLFLAICGVSLLLTGYLILLGMGPLVPPLDYTGALIYGPGPGFGWLLLWLVAALVIRAAAALARRSAGARVGAIWSGAAWLTLAALILAQAAILADFRGLL